MGILDGVAGLLQKGLEASLPMVGQFVSAVRDILGHIGELFYHYRDTRKLELIIQDAQRKCERLDREPDNLVDNAELFYEWYKEVVSDMPIISSYALASPLTGSYYGFLSSVSKGGRWLTQNDLAYNFDSLKTLKREAVAFMTKHNVKLASQDVLVAASIDIAYGRPYNPKKFEKMLNELHLAQPWIREWWAEQAKPEWMQGEVCGGILLEIKAKPSKKTKSSKSDVKPAKKKTKLAKKKKHDKVERKSSKQSNKSDTRKKSLKKNV